MYAGLQETNWIPRSFQEAAKNLAKEAVKRFLKPDQVVGLGSGPMAAAIVREMANFDRKETLECIPTSFQIKLEAECSGLKLVGEDRVPEVDVVFDGADEIDAKFNKGRRRRSIAGENSPLCRQADRDCGRIQKICAHLQLAGSD